MDPATVRKAGIAATVVVLVILVVLVVNAL